MTRTRTGSGGNNSRSDDDQGNDTELEMVNVLQFPAPGGRVSQLVSIRLSDEDLRKEPRL